MYYTTIDEVSFFFADCLPSGLWRMSYIILFLIMSRFFHFGDFHLVKLHVPARLSLVMQKRRFPAPVEYKARPPVVTLWTSYFWDGVIERANTPKHTLQYWIPNTELNNCSSDETELICNKICFGDSPKFLMRQWKCTNCTKSMLDFLLDDGKQITTCMTNLIVHTLMCEVQIRSLSKYIFHPIWFQYLVFSIGGYA